MADLATLGLLLSAGSVATSLATQPPKPARAPTPPNTVREDLVPPEDTLAETQATAQDRLRRKQAGVRSGLLQSSGQGELLNVRKKTLLGE